MCSEIVGVTETGGDADNKASFIRTTFYKDNFLLSFLLSVSGLAKSPARRPGATRNFSRATAISLLMSRRATMPLLDI